MKQLGFHPELFGSLRGWKLDLDSLETVWGVWNQARTVGVSNYIQLDAIVNPWLVWLDGLDGLDGLETVWTVWKRSDVSGTMPEVSEIQFWSFSFF